MDSLVSDFLLDIRASTIVKERYELLIELILDSVALGYSDKTKLRITEDYKVTDFIKILEPEKYKNKLKELNEEEF